MKMLFQLTSENPVLEIQVQEHVGEFQAWIHASIRQMVFGQVHYLLKGEPDKVNCHILIKLND